MLTGISNKMLSRIEADSESVVLRPWRDEASVTLTSAKYV